MASGKSVVDGVLKVLSPSLLEKFDHDSPFGCARAGYYKYVEGREEPQTGNMALGTELHRLNEALLLGEPAPAKDSQAQALFELGEKYLLSLKPRVLGVEAVMPDGFTLDGVEVSSRSKCDVVLDDGILDHKSTSSISSYAKSPGQLAKNSQMLIYSLAFHPKAEQVSLTHAYYQTKGRAMFEPRTVTVTRQQIDAQFENVIVPHINFVRDAVSKTRAEDVPFNLDACRMCAHKSYCPKDQKESPLMSFMNRFNRPAAAPAILPPDAPASDPTLAADPVEGFTPPAPAPTPKHEVFELTPAPEATPPESPAAKRGRGRPPGAKNKPKNPVAVPDEDAAVRYFEETTSTAPYTITKMTVGYGATVSLGNYQSARIDLSMEAKVNGDKDEVFRALLADIVAKVLAEVEQISKVKVK